MINTFILEGKLKEVSSIKETDRGTKFMKILIECERNFRNNENIIETDLIEVEVWRGVAEMCAESCNIHDLISIQGRIQSNTFKTNEGKEVTAYKFIGEKLSYLTKKSDY